MLKAKLKEKKKIVVRNLAKAKKKEEAPPYTQAGLLKSRNKVLSKMSLHEALYRGAIGGKKSNSPDPQSQKAKSLERPKIRIRKSPIKTNRDGSNGKTSLSNSTSPSHNPNPFSEQGQTQKDRILSKASLKAKKMEFEKISRNINEARSMTKLTQETRLKNVQFSNLL